MKESYREGVASHSGPEPCEGGGNVALEALDRGVWRLGIELRKRLEWRAGRCQTKRKATRAGSKTREPGRLHGVEDPRYAEKLQAREPGGPAAKPEHSKATLPIASQAA